MSTMPRRVPETCKRWFGPYAPPPLAKGARTHGAYRDALVVVSNWSDGRISWPRCRALGRRGGSGLLVEEELARAITHESAAALMYWFGVTCSTVWLWRRALARIIQTSRSKAAARGHPARLSRNSGRVRPRRHTAPLPPPGEGTATGCPTGQPEGWGTGIRRGAHRRSHT